MYVVEKKIKVWIVLQYKIIITKYQNIAINSFSIKHEHAHEVVVKNGSCITSHNKREEQAFYTKYTRK
jgi:hypothetical protein